MTYGFHPKARLEYLQAIDFYESRRTGLGAAFTREVEIDLPVHVARVPAAPFCETPQRLAQTPYSFELFRRFLGLS